MEIYLDRISDESVELYKKMDHNEALVRKQLVKTWTKVLEKYAKPGVPIPSVDAVRRELLRVGVDAGVKAVVDEHWLVFSFMVRDEIEHEVKKGLNMLDIPELIEYVKEAQKDPRVLDYLRGQIRYYVIG